MAFGGVAGGKLPGVLGGKSVDNFGTVHCREKAVTGAGKGVDFREIRQGKKHRQRSWKRTGPGRTVAAHHTARSCPACGGAGPLARPRRAEGKDVGIKAPI